MNDIKTLKELMDYAVSGKVPAEFENTDTESALRDEIKKIAGTYKLFQRNKIDVFEVLSETIDEILPQRVEAVIGMFAETRFLNQGQRAEFKIKRGKQRAKQFVTRSTESGVYETFRLDREKFDLYPKAYGGAGIIDFERYLDGAEDIMDIYEVIMDGLTEVVFTEVQTALIASWTDTGRPAANKVYANSFDIAKMQALCNTVSAYGSPVIYCTPQFAAEMSNAVTYSSTVKIPDQDVIEIRDRGYVGKFHGVPIVVLPQSFTDDTNSKFTFNPRFAFVIPAGQEKIVKVAFEGDTIVKSVDNQDNSMELQAYKKLAVGIVNTPNYWGMYYNAGIAAGGWAVISE